MTKKFQSLTLNYQLMNTKLLLMNLYEALKFSEKNVPLRSKKAGRFEKFLGFAMRHSIVTRGSVSLLCATTPQPYRFSKS